MTRISLIHIGDIHFPDHKSTPRADIKDTGLTKDFVDKISPLRMKGAMDALLGVLDSDETIHGLMLSGDLTSRSNMTGYDECVAYLESNLSGRSVWAESLMHVVHGNHDIVRDADTSSDALARYRATQAAWDARHLAILRADEVRSIPISESKASTWVHSVNSCVGCGESRRLPEKVRIQLGKLLAANGSDPISVDDFALLGEQLDTPAFDVAHLREISMRVSGDPDGVHVLLGHHPLLPQALPRIEIYTEAINAGLARSTLTELENRVFYCHGHVHDDPIEIVRDAVTGNEVVSVSAPLFVDGFNVLNFHFAADRRAPHSPAIPLGCEIIRYRERRSGALMPEQPVRISLCHAKQFDHIATPLHRHLLSELDDAPVRFPLLLAKVRAKVPGAPSDRVAEHLAHLDWHGLIDIAARSQAPSDWQIRRVGG